MATKIEKVRTSKGKKKKKKKYREYGDAEMHGKKDQLTFKIGMLF